MENTSPSDDQIIDICKATMMVSDQEFERLLVKTKKIRHSLLNIKTCIDSLRHTAETAPEVLPNLMGSVRQLLAELEKKAPPTCGCKKT